MVYCNHCMDEGCPECQTFDGDWSDDLDGVWVNDSGELCIACGLAEATVHLFGGSFCADCTPDFLKP